MILRFIFLSVSFASLTHAAEIKFSEEELARESVLPVFKNHKTVLNRNISFTKKISVGAGVGFVLNEPFNSSLQYGGIVNYHFDEAKALQLRFMSWDQANSSYSEQLDSKADTYFGITNRPRPEYLLLGNFQYSIFYGKISVAKQWVMNLSLYAIGGIGAIGIGGSMYPALDLGLGKKFYFNKSLALRLDLVSLIYNGPDVVGRAGRISAGEKASAFDTTTFVSNMLGVSLEYLFK